MATNSTFFFPSGLKRAFEEAKVPTPEAQQREDILRELRQASTDVTNMTGADIFDAAQRKVELKKAKSRAYYRIKSTRLLTAGARLLNLA